MTGRHRPESVGQLLWSSGRGRGRDWAGLCAWSVVEAVPAYLSGRLVAHAVDRGFLAGRPSTGFAWLALLAASVLVGAWATRKTYARLAVLVEPLRDELVRRTVSASLAQAAVAAAPPHAAAAARLSQHTEIAREAYASVLMVTQGFVVAGGGAILGLLSLAPALLLVVVPPLVVGLLLFAASLSRLAEAQRRAILAEERMADAGAGLALGATDVVACGAEGLMHRRLGRTIDAHAEAGRALARLTAVRTMTVALGGWLPLVLILVAGPWLLRHGSTPGVILGALTYVSQGLQPALETLVRGVGGPGLWLLVTLRRILDTTRPPPHPGVPADPPAPDGDRPADLSLRGVSFAYGAAAAPVVQDLDLTIRDGEHLAIVGPSGAGKSTLADLLAGMLVPDTGEVRVGGLPLAALGPRDLAGRRVLLPHDSYVFAGTVRENLAYYRSDASDPELDAVVRAFGLRPLVDDLGGYDALVDPAALTAGRRQLLTLARAYLAPARIVVLDESTCHLDATTEARVEELFAARPGTLVVIAHRISSALRAERILVLDGGRVTVGSHAEVLAGSCLYAEMVGWWSWAEPTTSAFAVTPATGGATMSRAAAAADELRRQGE